MTGAVRGAVRGAVSKGSSEMSIEMSSEWSSEWSSEGGSEGSRERSREESTHIRWLAFWKAEDDTVDSAVAEDDTVDSAVEPSLPPTLLVLPAGTHLDAFAKAAAEASDATEAASSPPSTGGVCRPAC